MRAIATVPSFRTWVAGEIATAAFFNTNVRDAGNFFLSMPVMECRQTIAQSFANGVFTAITFDTNDIDTDGGHSTSVNTHLYTAKTEGRYQISGGWSIAAHADSNARQVTLVLNGAVLVGSDSCVVGFSADNTRIAPGFRQVFMSVGDTMQIQGRQSSTISLNTVVATAQQPNMSVRWIGTT